MRCQQRGAGGPNTCAERRLCGPADSAGVFWTAAERSAAVAFGDDRRNVILPFEIVVADDFGVPADHGLRAAIALRKPAAEVVDGRFDIDADGGAYSRTKARA